MVHHNIIEKIEFIQEIHDNSIFPVFIFSEFEKLIYYNEQFYNTFNFEDKDDVHNIFEYLTYEQQRQEPLYFQDIPIKKLLNQELIFSYNKNADQKSSFKFITKLLGIMNGKRIFYVIVIELFSLRDKFVNESVRALLHASLLKDNETGSHVERINEYAYFLSKYLLEEKPDIFPEIDEHFIYEIGNVSSLHDVGKIGTPDYVLRKPAKLDDTEFEIMKEHTINGGLILSTVASEMARDIALFHHEWYNGEGYPYAMAYDNIPLSARIVSVCDVYDALRMERYYKKGFPHEKSINIIKEESGTHFQPEIVEAFIEKQDTFRKIFDTLTETKPTHS